MSKSALFLSSTFVLLSLTSPAYSQDRWEFEVRGGAAFPTVDVGDVPLDTGFGFEGIFHYRFLPHVGAYAGWDWMHFSGESGDVDVEETGYAFGLRFEHPFGGETGAGLAYWLRGGATVGHVELEDEAGDITADSGHGLGWEVGAGLSMQLGGHARFRPGVRYRSLSRDLDLGAGEQGVDLRYVTAEIAFGWRF